MEYMIKFHLTSFQKDKILLDLFGLHQESYSQIENENDYDVLTDHPAITQHISTALSFFSRENVSYDDHTSSFLTQNQHVLVNKDNYTYVSSVIREMNGISEPSIPQYTAKSNKAKLIYAEMMKYEKNEVKHDDSLDLKDVLSILCNAKDNGINVFNVMDLTIYQVYEHFERMNIKENHDRILPVWANGHLPETQKLPEWITKTKL